MTSGAKERVRLRLLRHGQVPNHRSDVAPTDLGLAQAEAAGTWFANEEIEIACLLSGETRRTRDTASVFASAYRNAGGEVADPIVSFALRNPDLYLGGQRINMGEGAAMLAAQSPAVSVEDVEASPFFSDFMEAKDRVGFWLEHGNPPGETARDVGFRIDHFARSLCDVPAWAGQIVVAITHSPVMRAVRYQHWAEYSSEPPFLHGYDLVVGADGDLSLSEFATDTGDIPATARPGPGVVREPAQTQDEPNSSSSKENL